MLRLDIKMAEMTPSEYKELSSSIADIKTELLRIRHFLESDTSTKKVGAIEQISLINDRVNLIETKIKMRDFKMATYVGVLVTIFYVVGWFAEKIWKIFSDR